MLPYHARPHHWLDHPASRSRRRHPSWNRMTAAVISAGSGNRPVATVAVLSSSTDQFIFASTSLASRFLVITSTGATDRFVLDVPTGTADRFAGASTCTTSWFVVASTGQADRFVVDALTATGTSSQDRLVVAG